MACGSNDMPLSLEQSPLSPFLNTGHTIALPHSTGTLSTLQKSLNIFNIHRMTSSHRIVSTGSPSHPWLFPFFIFPIAISNSSIVIALSSPFIWSCSTLRSGGFPSLSSRLYNSEKYSPHLSLISSGSTLSLPSLSFTECVTNDSCLRRFFAMLYINFLVPSTSCLNCSPILSHDCSIALLFMVSASFLLTTYSALVSGDLLFIHALNFLFFSFTARATSSVHHAVFFFLRPILFTPIVSLAHVIIFFLKYSHSPSTSTTFSPSSGIISQTLSTKTLFTSSSFNLSTDIRSLITIFAGSGVFRFNIPTTKR